MNFPATAHEHSLILAPFDDGIPDFLDAWFVLHPSLPHAPTVGIHPVDFVKQPECFDFVFVTEGLAGRLISHGIDAETEARIISRFGWSWPEARLENASTNFPRGS